MFKRIVCLCLALALATLPSIGLSQVSQANKGNVMAANDARAFNYPTAWTTAGVATGAQTVTVAGDAFAVTPDGRVFLPFGTNRPILFDKNGTPETLVPSAVTCTQNGPQATCTITATFVSAHTGPFSINSGTYGICEAAVDLPSAGGMVVVNSGFGGTSAIITTATTGAGACGAATILILDVRAGAFSFYNFIGSATYAAGSGFSAGRLLTAQGATIASGGASCVAGDCTLGTDGNFFIISGTTTIDGFATVGWRAGSIIVLNTSGSITFTNAGTVAGGYGAMLLVGGANVSMTANDNMILIFDGTAWQQIAPTLVK